MQLGCLNHALLTAQAVRAAGLPLGGWIANCVDPDMQVVDENVAALEQRLEGPLLGVLRFEQNPDAKKFSVLLNIAGMTMDGMD
jgi:dethiobiotin synthetase